MSALVEHLQQHARKDPQHTALIVPQLDKPARCITYAELSRRVGRLALTLQLQTKWEGAASIIPILCGKNDDAVEAMFAVLAAGGAFASLNRKLKLPQINAVVEQSRAPFGIVDPQNLSALVAASTDDAQALQNPWHLLADHELTSNQMKQLEALRKRVRGELLGSGESPGASLQMARRAADSVGCCLFTSGSTGKPKGVLISDADLVARATAEAECFGLSADDVLLCVLPFSFDVGLNQLMSAIVAGCTIVLSESWLPADILNHAARFGVTGISAVPSIWNDLLGSGLRFNPAGEHRTLRYVTVSGGDMPRDRLQALQGAVGKAGIFKTYGQSETFRSTALLASDFRAKSMSVGKAFAGARVYIVRTDGTQAAAGERGEIIHTGLGTMLRYLDDEDGDKLRPNPFRSAIDPSPYAVFTGDIGSLDEGGFLYIHGRDDSMLKVAGNRIYPKEIADQIASVPGVRQVEVIGKKNPQGDTDVHAFIAGTSLDAMDLRRQLMQLLPSYMVPRRIHLLPELPRTASGKPDRPALIAQL